MKYGTVPHFDRPISRIVLGSVPFTTETLDNVFALMDTYLAAGGNTIDLSHVYRGGDCHRAVSAYFKARKNRDQFVLFDKGCHHYSTRRVTRECMASDIADNHQNLDSGYTEFFVLHRDDPMVPAGQIVKWLNEHKDGGRISVFGGSNFHHYRIREANEYAAQHGLQGFSASSPNFSLALPNEPMWMECLHLDRVARDWYEESKFPVFSWSSAGGGFFAKVDSPDVRRVYHNKHNFERLARAEEFSKKYSTSPNAIALAWTLNQPLNVFGLIGPANVAQLKDNLEAAEIVLDPDELRYLELG